MTKWLVKMQNTWLLIAVLAISSADPAARGRGLDDDLPIPDDLRASIEKSSQIGRELYWIDKAAAIGTDVLFENVKDLSDKRIAGYIPLREGDDDGKPTNAFLVSFFTSDMPPKIAYEIRVVTNGKSTFQMHNPPKATSPDLAALIQARKTAIAAMPQTSQPINPILLPGQAIGEEGVLVYLLAGTSKPNVAVFGKHFRSLVPIGGSSVTYMKALSNSVIEIPTRGPNGEEPEALVVSQIVSDFPVETHVFTSLLVKKTVYVQTKRGLWRVDGDKIALVNDKPPERSK